MKSIGFGDIARTLVWQGQQIKLQAGDFTWQDHQDYFALTGTELGAAFAAGANPRLAVPLVWLHERKGRRRLTFDEFLKQAVGGGGFADVEWLVDEDSDDAPLEESGDPEASGDGS